MSQQSLTFLSQSAGNLFKPTKPPGGTATFRKNESGTMILKGDAARDLERIFEEDKENERIKEDSRPMRLCEYHYATSRQMGQERVRLGVLNLPPKPIASIPGYSGFIPRKESANIIGQTYKCCNLQSSELFALEQESQRESHANILKPNSDLRTPETY